MTYYPPPHGWAMFGAHAGMYPTPDVEFSGEGHEDGLPIWERCPRCPVDGAPCSIIRAEKMLHSRGVDWFKVCLVAETGSTVHGISPGGGDQDLTAVWTEDLRGLVTDGPRRGARMVRTQADGVRSGPGDIDMQVYSMRKFVGLAANGNPSILAGLFAPEDRILWNDGFPAERIRELSWTRRAGEAFLGYLDSQYKRWADGKIAQRVKRPELVEALGFDAKFASHAIRLGIQGAEYLETGRIVLPMEEPAVSRLRAVRAGEVPEVEALAWCREVRAKLVDALDASKLPKHSDMEAVGDFLEDWYAVRLSPALKERNFWS